MDWTWLINFCDESGKDELLDWKRMGECVFSPCPDDCGEGEEGFFTGFNKGFSDSCLWHVGSEVGAVGEGAGIDFNFPISDKSAIGIDVADVEGGGIFR